jgi:hypothetical protein
MPSEEESIGFSGCLVIFTGVGFFGAGSSLYLNPRWQDQQIK